MSQRLLQAQTNAVTQVASDAIETTGNVIENGLNKLADSASNIPEIGGALSRDFDGLAEHRLLQSSWAPPAFRPAGILSGPASPMDS